MKWIRLQWDRVAAWSAVALGAVVLLVGWVGVSGTEYPAEQIPYIVSGGLCGVFLLGIGAVLWLSADLRDEWRKLDRIEHALRERQDGAGTLDASPPALADDGDDAAEEASSSGSPVPSARRRRVKAGAGSS